MSLIRPHITQQTNYFGSSLEGTEVSLGKPNSLNSEIKRSPLESLIHHHAAEISQVTSQQPRVCQIEEQSSLENGINILQYQFKDCQTKATHLNNLKQNLKRRLKSAKVQGNRQLVASLNEEFKELMTI